MKEREGDRNKPAPARRRLLAAAPSRSTFLRGIGSQYEELHRAYELIVQRH
jgi:hypothetical protein